MNGTLKGAPMSPNEKSLLIDVTHNHRAARMHPETIFRVEIFYQQLIGLFEYIQRVLRGMVVAVRSFSKMIESTKVVDDPQVCIGVLSKLSDLVTPDVCM